MMTLTLALNWAATYLVHSTLLLLLAWTASRLLRDRRIALQETLWRGALFGALVTASLQVGAPALNLFEASPATGAEAALLAEESAALSATPLAEAALLPAEEESVAVNASPLALPAWAFVSASVLWTLGALFGLARLALACRNESRFRRSPKDDALNSGN